ncbi:kinase-like domain-containing protein [Fusarium flagelliforme]|uniref:ethanolamine kinase n=1 Tax=Fusarium flagelliforme TaxID=2675880 RepID=A0A395MYG8_9HYPO|nr:kinase-like domain-containing protein [Fusarium flagelliforme]KAH7179863.1 kinase-like domain-containing protein [Fusarium flagelliforme]RFN52695.1 ethanolamine kinase [Fusarium flagelliforme]
MEIPFLDCVFDSSDPNASILPLIPYLFPAADEADIDPHVQALAQGTTNGLFKVTNQANAVLVKVYGDGTDITIDRNKELWVHKLLAQHGLSSWPLVRFKNGHGYQFIPGRVCSEGDMSKTEIFRGVARELARWHALLQPVDLQGARKELHYEPSVWSTARKWLKAISNGEKRSRDEIEGLQEKFQYLTDKLLPTDVMPEPLVLGHGDLLCGNIIVQESADGMGAVNGATDVATVRFIDYEHATYCPRAFELANHFAEWTGFECDYDKLPSTSIRRAFIREYLKTHAEVRRDTTCNGTKETADLPTVTDAEVEKLMRQVDDYRGFPGFYWGLCALIQAETATGTIDFDYAGYAEKRFAEYEAWRKVQDNDIVEMPLREKIWARP